MEKAVAPHSSTLAWKIPGTGEPGGLQSMGSLGVGHDWATSVSLFTFIHWRRKWQPTPVFSPGESQGRGSLVGCRLCGPSSVGHYWSDLAAAAAAAATSGCLAWLTVCRWKIWSGRKKTCKWPTGTWKNTQHHYSSGKWKSKPQWAITSHLLEWLSWRKARDKKCWWECGEKGPLVHCW